MLWVFVLALIMPISFASCEDAANLAQVTWAHAVNSQDALTTTFANEKVQMIEADVVLGQLKQQEVEQPAEQPEEIKPQRNTKNADEKPQEQPAQQTPAEQTPVEQTPAEQKPAEQTPAEETPVQPNAADPVQDGTPDGTPVMAHDEGSVSDLSLSEFLDKVADHNKDAKNPKGVKLDFKSISALEQSLDLFAKAKDLKAPLWINADIIKGPGGKAGAEVNAKRFFDGIQKTAELTNKTLSIGWTTGLPDNEKVSYNQTHIDNMLKAIDDSKIPVGYPITFPVRAAIAAESKESLTKLVDTVSKDGREVTLTIWSGEQDTDKVDHEKLKDIINTFTVKKVYVDVPVDLADKLTGAATIAKFGLLNLAAIAFAMLFRNGLH